MSSDLTRICANCGAANESSDLFCKECGASLAMVSSNYGQTAAFTPVTADQTGTVAVAPVAVPSPYQPIQPYTGSYDPIEESPRGAVLGWIAATIILILIAFFFWAAVLSDATRDRFLGIF